MSVPSRAGCHAVHELGFRFGRWVIDPVKSDNLLCEEGSGHHRQRHRGADIVGVLTADSMRGAHFGAKRSRADGDEPTWLSRIIGLLLSRERQEALAPRSSSACAKKTYRSTPSAETGRSLKP